MPEREFEYFPSPENDDDNERIAYQFLYCSSAVEEWPRFRRELEESGAKTSKQCDDLETNAINIFREVRDAILAAIEYDDPGCYVAGAFARPPSSCTRFHRPAWGSREFAGVS